MALKDFVSIIQNSDVQRSNRYVVEIQPPNIPGLGMKPQDHINLMVQDVNFPGQNIRTSTDDLRQGPTREIAQAVTYGSINMTFLCTPGLPEKLFFEGWQGLMFNRVTWQAKYYKSYIGQIKLRALDRTDLVRYGIILYEAFPKIINAQDYSNTSTDTAQTLQIEFAFHHWAMDEDLYSSSDEFYGSRNEDEGKPKPKRKKLAGTENMSDAELMAFYNGEIRNELGQNFNEAMAAAGVPTSVISLSSQVTNAALSDAPSVTTVVGGGKFGMLQEAVQASAHPSAALSPTGALSGSSGLMSALMGVMGKLAANAAPTPKPKIQTKMEYMTSVEQGLDGKVKEMKVASATASASTWVDPNTGKSVSATSTGAGSSLGMINCWGAAPPDNSPAVATTMFGGLTSAKGLSHSTGSIDSIAGVRSQAVKNIGGDISGLMSGIVANVSIARGATALTGSKFSLTKSVAGLGLPMLSVGTMMSAASSLGGKASFGGAQGGQDR